MSKFLKFIVNLVVICAILIAAALLVPHFAGINMVMNDNSSQETNLPVGSVAYGKDAEATDLEKGDKIIYTNSSQAYIYEITDMDATAGSYKVKDVYDVNAQETEVQLINNAVKVLVVVPYIAYAAIALQSKEGLIVVGLGVIFLIILFILAELWRKDDEDEEEEDEEEDEDEDDETDEEEEDEDEEDEEKLSRKERKRLKKEEKQRKKEEKRRKKLAKKGLLDEEEAEPQEEQPDKEETAEPDVYTDAMKDSMAQLAESIAQVQSGQDSGDAEAVEEKEQKALQEQETIRLSEVSEKLEEKTKPEERQMETVEQVPVRDKEAVLPALSVMELLSKAEAAGESPEVIKDEENDITLLDYSDIL